MRRRFLGLSLAVLVLPLFVQLPATAAPEACPDVAGALSTQAGLVTAASWVTCAGPTAVGTSDLDVGLSGTAALLTTGLAAHADPAVLGEPTSTAWSADASYGYARDVASYQVTVDVPSGDNCLAFDYAFGSDDFAEVPGTGEYYRDGFVATVLQNDWTLQLGAGEYSVAGAGVFHSFAVAPGVSWAATNATGYGAVTGPREAVLGVPPGQTTITLSVYDAGRAISSATDAAGDSGLFVNGLRSFADPNGCASPYNDLPVVGDDGSAVAPVPVVAGTTTPIAVLDNDYDADGLQFDSVPVQPAHGTVSCAPLASDPMRGACAYTPGAGYQGPDQFSYRVTDGRGGFGEATVYVDVGTQDLRTLDTLDLRQVVVGGTAKVRVSGQVSWPGGLPADGAEVSLLAAPTGSPLVAVGQVTADELGGFSFDHLPAQAGGWSYRAELASGAHVENSITFDPDPVTAVAIAGPRVVQAGQQVSYAVSATRLSGGTATSWSGTCEAWEADPPPLGCQTSDGSAELALTFPNEGSAMLQVTIGSAYATCPIDVVGDPVTSPPGCDDAPPPALTGLSLEPVDAGPYQAGKAVRFAVQATPAGAHAFVCGYGADPGPGIAPALADIDATNCGDGSGTSTTDSAGVGTACFVPPSAGDWFYAVAGPTALNDFDNAPKDFVKFHVDEASGSPEPCSGGAGGPSPTELSLSGPQSGPVGTTATFTISSTPTDATGGLDCELLDDAQTTLGPLDCEPLSAGTSTVSFTPDAAGTFVIRVRSGLVESTWPFEATAVASGLKVGTVSGPATAYVGIPARYGLLVTKDGVPDGAHALSCGAYQASDPDTPYPATDCPATSNPDGSAAFTFVPPHPGTFYVGGYVNGNRLTTQPKTVTVVEPVVTSLTAALQRASVVWPAAPVVTGKVATNGFDPGALQVQLWAGPKAGAMTQVGSYRPTATGALSVQVSRRPTATYYQWRITGHASSAFVRATVVPLVSLAVTKAGTKRVFGGRVTPARAGAVLWLQRRSAGTAWRTVKTLRLTGSSTALAVAEGARYAFSLRKTTGTRWYRVVVPADSGRQQAISRTVRVR